jgi:hypothetical protein
MTINWVTDCDFCHQGRDTKIAQKVKIVETYWHDHSLESSWEALYDGAISCSIQFILGGKIHFLNFALKKS